MKIYILEDDIDQSELYKLWLETYECKTFDKARELIQHIPFEPPTILLIDWNLPKIGGLDVLHWLKGSRHSDIPVIFLTSRNTEEDIVRALTDGADDYIVKPVNQAILLARIKAVIRRQVHNKPSHSFDPKPYTFNYKTNCISYNNENISLTNKEFELALFFFKNEDSLVSRDQLLESIWAQNSSLNTRTVDTHISRLRKKLELNGTHGWKLISIYHKGYKLINQRNV